MKIKPELKVGDKVILLHMEGEFLSPGLKGVVTAAIPDPMAEKKGSMIYDVKWENGEHKGLIEETDFWAHDNDSINENRDFDKWAVDNIDVLRYFDVHKIDDFLLKIRESGIVNMHQSSPYLYLGKERIAHEFYYNRPQNEEDFQAILDMADEIQSELINGTINYLEDNNKSLELDIINSFIKRFAEKLVMLYIMIRS